VNKALLLFFFAVLLVYPVYSQNKIGLTPSKTKGSSIGIKVNSPMQQTIIDTIYTENSLQATVSYTMETNTYNAYVLSLYDSHINVGDFAVTYGVPPSPIFNIGIRFYLSFPIRTIPLGYTIENVKFMLYQLYCHSNEGDHHFPSFYGTHYNLLVDHVDYGNNIEISDFNPVNYGTIGSISNNETIGWKILSVTSQYLLDVYQNRQYIQFMIYFPIICDWDYCDDCVVFRSSHHGSSIGHPQIVVTYRSTNSISDYVTAHNPLVFLYPNPCRDYVTISVKDNTSLISADLFNVKGQAVKTIHKADNDQKNVTLEFDRGIKSGIYLLKYTVRSLGKDLIGTKKIIVN